MSVTIPSLGHSRTSLAEGHPTAVGTSRDLKSRTGLLTDRTGIAPNRSGSSGQKLGTLTGLLGAVLLCLFVAGCANLSSSVPVERHQPQAMEGLGAGDTLKITYLGAPELNQVVKIPPDGHLTLPYISGPVNAIGQSTTSLQREFTDRCQELKLKTVIVTQQDSAKCVYVTGAIKAIVPLLHPMTVSQVVAAAGGVPEDAMDRPVKLRCVEMGKSVSYAVRLDDPNPVYVKSGDEIWVDGNNF